MSARGRNIFSTPTGVWLTNYLPRYSSNSQLRLTLFQFLFCTLLVCPLSGGLIPKQICSHLTNLDLFTALGDSISPEMPPDMLEGVMSGIAHATMDLDRTVGGLGTQTVRIVIAHADLMAQLLLDGDPRGLAGRLGLAVTWSISTAVRRIRSRSISCWVASSTNGH